MGANYSEIQELLQQRADIQARINLLPYDGNPEIKEVNGAKFLVNYPSPLNTKKERLQCLSLGWCYHF